MSEQGASEQTTSPWFAAWRRRRQARRWVDGNRLTLLRDGQAAYPAMLAAIAAAQRRICLEVYIFAPDLTGARFVAALLARARAGVEVRLIIDAVGSSGFLERYADELAGAGIKLAEFHPVAPWRRNWNISHRDHRKILVVDDRLAFLGGLNVGDDYAAIADGGRGWHDMHCALEGPVVADVAALFQRTWVAAGGPSFARGAVPDAQGSVKARILQNGPRRYRRTIYQAYVAALAMARARIYIKSAYFLPDRPLRRAFVAAVKRGVDVRVIVPGNSDVKVVEWASRYAFRRLIAQGVRIFRWQGPMMHAKVAVADAHWATLGSSNLDARSFRYNLEVNVEFFDDDVAQDLDAMFTSDLANCVEVTSADWTAMGVATRALAWLCYRFRRWL